MTTVSRTFPAVRAFADPDRRTVSMILVALIHVATVIGDLDERWDTPLVVRLIIIALGGFLVGANLASVHLPPVVSPRQFARFALVLYGVWWTIVAVAIMSNNGASTGTDDALIPAFIFIGSPELLGVAAGPIAVIAMITVGSLVRSDHRRGRWRSFVAPSHVVRARHSLGLVVGVGLFAFARPITDLLARQHVERVTVDAAGNVSQLVGPQLPLFAWVVITAFSVSVVLGTAWTFVGARVVRVRSRSIGLVHLYASAVSLAFVVRLMTLLTVAPTRTDAGDPLFYHSTANMLANGLGFPEPLNFIAHQRWIASALHGPLYPLVLSISSRFGGTTFFDHKMFSLVIGTALVALVGVVARRVAQPDRRHHVAIVAMVLAAIYPNLWIIDGVLFPEGLMALCTTATVWAAFRWKSTPARRWAVAMGLLTGLAALTRGEGLLLSILLIVPLVMTTREVSLRRRVSHVAWAAIACLVVLAPWAIRNARSFEVSVPLSTNGNELFVYANCDEVYSGKFLGFWSFDCQEKLREQGIDATGDEAEKSLFWRRVGFDYARENIGELPKVIAARIGRQWDVFRPIQNTEFAPIEGRDKQAARAGLLMYYGLAALSIVGVRQLRRRRVTLIPFAALFISVTLTAAYAYGTTRFRVPVEPALCVLAAVGIFPLLDRLRRRFPANDRHDDRRVTTEPSQTFVSGARVSLRRVVARDSWRNWLSFGFVMATIAVALPALFRSVGATMEEGFMLVFPERVLRGAIANVDFLHLYGPGSLHLLAGWFEMFGTSITAERWFGLGQHLLIISALYMLARPWGRRVAVVVGATSTLFVLTPIGLQALAWSGGVGFMLWSVVFLVRSMHLERVGSPARWSRVSAGVLAGIALTFRPDLVVAVVLAGVFSLRHRSWRSWAITIAAVAAGAISMWIHLVQAGPRAVIRGVFIDPVFELRGGRELPRPPSWSHLDGALQIIAEKVAPSWPIPHIGESRQLFLWFFILPVSALFVLAIGMQAHRRSHSGDGAGRSRATVLVAVGLVSIGLLPQAFQRPDSAHLLWVACVPWPFLVPTVLEWCRWNRARSHPAVRVASAVLVVVALVTIVAPSYTIRTYSHLVKDSITNTPPRFEVSRGDRYFYLGDERPYEASLEVVDALDQLATPGERLLVGPVDLRNTTYSDAFFYHLFPELVPATRYIEMDPGIANATDSGLADDVRSADWLVLTRFWSGWIEPNDSVEFGSDEPNQVVEDLFCLRGSFQHDLVRLYQRCPVGDDIGPYDAPYQPEFDYAVEVRVPVPARPDGTCTPTCNGEFDPDYADIDTSTIEAD